MVQLLIIMIKTDIRIHYRLIMKSTIIFLIPVILLSFSAKSQVIVPKKNLEEIEIGITYEDVVWILGFEGTKILKENAPEMLTGHVNELGIAFDYVVNYRYIMDLPITSVYFKDDLLVFFTISSYPEYNQFICQDLATSEGLKFWDPIKKAVDIYGQYKVLDAGEGNIVYHAYPEKGICLGIDSGEVRTISIFDQNF